MTSPTSFRLPPEIQKLLAKMSKETELSRTAIVVLALREFSRRHGYGK